MEIRLDADAGSSVSGIVAEQMSFDMSKQAKLFHMLSSSLYSNKPASIVRELCSNAYDSHKMAGVLDRPFLLVAPSYEVPELVVKDFGVGLTSEEAKKTILCYLGSNKDTSNEYIGGWGIGSKSPFAYAKNYTVITIKNGIRAEFLCWKDEHGLPRNALVSEEPTTEESGVEMRVPVEASDIRTFTRTVREYVLWSNYNLNAKVFLHGDEEIESRKPIDTLPVCGTNMMLFEGGTGSIRIVYGGFSYEMASCIDERFDHHSLWERMEASMNQGYDIALVVDQPGVIDFNMNREELEQTARTQKFVMDIVTYLTTQAMTLSTSFDRRMEALAVEREVELAAWRLEADAGAVKPAADNLAVMSTFIDDALSAATNEDRIFAKAFRVFEHTFGYEFRGVNSRKVSFHAGVTRLYNAKLRVAPIHDQLVIVYCRVMNPPRAYRDKIREFDKSYGSASGLDRIAYFVKAATEEEAKETLSASTDFVGMDLSKFTFHEIKVPAPPKHVPGTRLRSSTMRIYDVDTKSYVKYDKDNTFVMKDKDHDPSKFDTARFAITGRRVFTFTPTPEFVKRYVGAAPNLHTEEGFLEQFFEAGEAKLIKWGGITEEMIAAAKRVMELAANLDDSFNLPLKLVMKARKIHLAASEMIKCAEEVRRTKASLGYVDGGVKFETDHWVADVDRMRIDVKEMQEVRHRTKFLNMSTITRNSTDPVAVSLIDALKIGAWI